MTRRRRRSDRAGCPWDNAMAESFVRTLKREEVKGQAYRDRAEAEASIETFIEAVSNRHRLHSALAYLAPEEFEAKQNAPSCLAVSVAGGGSLSPVTIDVHSL
jgi:transposase InsO family protein